MHLCTRLGVRFYCNKREIMTSLLFRDMHAFLQWNLLGENQWKLKSARWIMPSLDASRCTMHSEYWMLHACRFSIWTVFRWLTPWLALSPSIAFAFCIADTLDPTHGGEGCHELHCRLRRQILWLLSGGNWLSDGKGKWCLYNRPTNDD